MALDQESKRKIVTLECLEKFKELVNKYSFSIEGNTLTITDLTQENSTTSSQGE